MSHQPKSAGYQERSSQKRVWPTGLFERGIIPLLLSTALGEVAGNIVYIILIEIAFKLGGGAASVGWVLFVQSVPQIFLGVWAGSMVDRLGVHRAAVLSTLTYTGLVVGLVASQQILIVYLLAFLLMLVRLVLTPARLGLISYASSKAKLVSNNTSFSIVTGLGLFFGPAISAGLLFVIGGFQVPLVIASGGLLLSIIPLRFVTDPKITAQPTGSVSIWQEMKTGWQYIRNHPHVWKVLLCLVHYTLVMGAVTPLFAPLAHNLGLGSEGTGVFFAAVGFGGLIGAPLAILLSKELGMTLTLLLMGLLAPFGILFVGLTDHRTNAIVALMLVALAGASINVIVITVLQRLTPLKIQGTVFGVQQTFMGIAWGTSLAAMTGGLTFWPRVNVPFLFLGIGGAGLLFFLICWFWHWHPIQAACQRCTPRIQVLGAVCQAICGTQFGGGKKICLLICSKYS